MASKNLSLVAASLATLALSACGGGGGGSNTTQGSNDAPITITSSNANAVASLSASAVGAGVSSIQTIATYVTGADIQTASTNTGGRLINLQTIISSAMQRAFRHPGQRAVATGVAITDEWPCADSGSISLSADLKNPDGDTPDVGDQGTLTYNNCTEGGATMSGQMKITVTAVSGNYETAVTETTDTSFTNFKVTQTGAATSLTINGTARSSDTYNIHGPLSNWLKSDRLSYQLQRGSQTASLTLTGVDIQSEGTMTGYSVGIAETAAFSFPALSGNGAITTLTPIAVSSSGSVISGKIKLAGNGSSQYLTFLGNDTVKVETDTNNDGQIDLTNTTTLTALNAAAWQQ
jgi:hypothetical protein